MSASQFFNSATDKSLIPKHPRIICSRETFFRKHKHYLTTNILPTVEDEGITVCRPQYVSDVNLKEPDVEINDTIGLAEKSNTLADTVMDL